VERSGGGDDFPPLGGQLNGDAFAQSNGITVGSPNDQQPRANGQQTQLPNRENTGAFQQNQQPPSTLQTQQLPSQNGQPSPAPSAVKKYADMTENEQWGLPGLMAAFEARRLAENGGQVDDTLPPALRSTVIMGHDLKSLGLNLDSPDPLYPTFTPFEAIGSSGSTFDFHERNMIPDFTLPSAYTVTNVPNLNGRINAFSDGNLCPGA
jgi:CCR4-NOT transcription complex subunit 2